VHRALHGVAAADRACRLPNEVEGHLSGCRSPCMGIFDPNVTSTRSPWASRTHPFSGNADKLTIEEQRATAASNQRAQLLSLQLVEREAETALLRAELAEARRSTGQALQAGSAAEADFRLALERSSGLYEAEVLHLKSLLEVSAYSSSSRSCQPQNALLTCSPPVRFHWTA